MSFDLQQLKTIIVVMMENRSFDNLLGYLSLDAKNPVVEGLKSSQAWLQQFANSYNQDKYQPYYLDDPYHVIDGDPPHERDPIAKQLGIPKNGKYPLDGFVQNYAGAKEKPVISPSHKPPVMGYFTQKEAPVTDFFFQHFAIFDHWFSSLPAGTQPNRLMAMSGETGIDVNHVPIPKQRLVYDWLNDHGISWRVYHEGMPFFALMLDWIPDILLEKNFRPLERLYGDIQNREDDPQFPEVIFIEPTYTDATHVGPSSDDHSPSAIKGGQQFLSRIYRTITAADLEFWKSSATIVTYDEHGGFFDHISPPPIKTMPPEGINYPPFESLGVRVPAFVISPFVPAKKVCSDVMDHTSILKLIGKRFSKDGKYSAVVDERPVGAIDKIFVQPDDPNKNPPSLDSLRDYLDAEKPIPVVGYIPGKEPESRLQEAFQQALQTIHDKDIPKSSLFKNLIDHFIA